MQTVPYVSILVPVYNVEQYLEQCLDSLVSQTLANIEIICINDGSTDSSPEILERFAAADPRIKLINKKNSGYGASMNQGLELAQGEYVGIVESDDYAERDMFERLYAAAREHEVAVVRSDYFFTWSEQDTRDAVRSYYPSSSYGKVLDTLEHYEVYQVPPAIWSGLYRRSLLEDWNIRFLESPGASFQDTGFNYKILMATDRLYVLNTPFIHYRQDNVASSVKAVSKIYLVVEELKSALGFLENFPAKRTLVRRVMQGIAYQTYRWNIIRIAKEHREEFCAFMYDWFLAAQEAGELRQEYFVLGMYAELDLLLTNPQRYLKKLNSWTNTQLSKRGRDVHFTTAGFLVALRSYLRRRLGLVSKE
jgi:glycosyltransferase involved in cell wall biosynthesis